MGRHRASPDGWEFASVGPGQAPGPDVIASTPDQVLGALAAMPGTLPWEDVAPGILPQFDRVRPYHPALADRVVTIVPPGVPIGLGIDVGPALIHVSASMVGSWSMTLADVTARALANLHERAAKVRPEAVVWDTIGDARTGWLQTGLSIGAALVLAPQELGRILGTGPRILVAPMRDLLIALPPEEVDLATWLYDEVARQDPNCLHPRLYLFDGHAVSLAAVGVASPVATG